MKKLFIQFYLLLFVCFLVMSLLRAGAGHFPLYSESLINI